MPTRMLRDWTDSDKVNNLSAEAERFFVRLIMKVDDHGGYFADARRLLPSLFPFLLHKVREKDVERWVEECEKSGLIVVFTHENKQYLKILEFKQRLDKARAKFPFPPDDLIKQKVSEQIPVSGKSLTTSNDFPAETETDIEKKTKKKDSPKGDAGAIAPATEQEVLYADIEKSKRAIVDFIRDQKPLFIQPYVDLWNIFAKERSLPQVTKISNSRKRKFQVRIREKGFDFIEILKKAGKSEFLLTGNWFGFDWIFQNDSNFLKIMEGKYDQKTPARAAQVKQQFTPIVQMPKTFNDEVKYFLGRYQEGELNSALLSEDFCRKLIVRSGQNIDLEAYTGNTEADRLRAAVISIFASMSKKEVPA